MSYSFNVRAASKDEAKSAIAAELDKVVAQQQVHTKDRDAAVAAASAFVDMLGDLAESQQYSVSVNGSLGWRAENDYTSANVGVSASIVSI
jgi:hypothetical protein